jgi:hypothetical protein
MARLVRAIHNPLTVWMARIKRAMTIGEVVQKKLTGSTSTATRTAVGAFTSASQAFR